MSGFARRLQRVAQVAVPSDGEPTLASTGPRVSLASVGATISPTFSGSETMINVGDDWDALITANAPGTVFRVQAGVHRRTAHSLAPKDGMQFIGEPGAIVSGAEDIGDTGWTQVGSVWHKTNASWPATSDGGVGPGQFNPGWEAGRQREDLTVDLVPLQRLGSGGDAGAAGFTTTPGAGQWSYDSATKTIYLGQDPTGHSIEVSFDLGLNYFMWSQSGQAERVVLQNLVIRHYATSNQDAAIKCLDAGGGIGTDTVFPMNTVTNGYDYQGNVPEGNTDPVLGGWLIDHCQVTLCHSVGVFAGPGTIVRDSDISLNGQVGGKGAGRNIVYERCTIDDNNYTHYDSFVEAGGFKSWNTANTTMRDCSFSNNLGIAAWNDYVFEGHLYEYCHFEDNEGPGIDIEMSEGTEVHHCQFLGNATISYTDSLTDPDYAANYCSGQLFGYNSRNASIHDNYFDTKMNGWGAIFFQEQERGGVHPYAQGTGDPSPSGTYAGLRATCSGAQVVNNSITIRTPAHGNAAGWRAIVTQDYGTYDDQPSGKIAGWVLRTDTDYGDPGSYTYTLQWSQNYYHLPASVASGNSDPLLQSAASVNYANYPFRWDGQYDYQVFQLPAPYTGTNLYYVADAGRRFGNAAQWQLALAPAGDGTGGFGQDGDSSVLYDQPS
ncbi:hypothetical protein CSA80_03835 [Candidatus Saccharibacteria bacterium]|nr:MAG: hypothetical protein CSA80_03835 [Candidatus Saccharibacteria bacterium]